MILIGEKLNSSIPSAKALMDKGDFDALTALARSQQEAGCAYIDVNTAMMPDEEGYMITLLERLTKGCACGICVDSPSSRVINASLERIEGRECMVNSTDDIRLPEILDNVIKRDAAVIVMPRLNDKRGSARQAVKTLVHAGLDREKIYVDIVTEALAANTEAAKNAVGFMSFVKDELGVRALSGLSNISFGLPARRAMNAAFMAVLAYHGLDGAICDVLDTGVRGAAAAGFALSGGDEFCMDYLTAMRQGNTA